MLTAQSDHAIIIINFYLCSSFFSCNGLSQHAVTPSILQTGLCIVSFGTFTCISSHLDTATDASDVQNQK